MFPSSAVLCTLLRTARLLEKSECLSSTPVFLETRAVFGREVLLGSKILNGARRKNRHVCCLFLVCEHSLLTRLEHCDHAPLIPPSAVPTWLSRAFLAVFRSKPGVACHRLLRCCLTFTDGFARPQSELTSMSALRVAPNTELKTELTRLWVGNFRAKLSSHDDFRS